MKGSLRRARRAIIFFFMAAGCSYGVLMARIPSLREQLHTGDALIGMAMLCLGIGGLLAFACMHLWFASFKSRNVLAVSSVLLLAGIPVCALAWDAVSFCTMFGILGFCYALFDVTINMQGILLEHKIRKYCMSGLHATYNIGGLAGSVLGAFLVGIGLTPFPTFLIVCSLLAIGWLLSIPHLLNEPQSQQEHENLGSIKVPMIIIVCGFLALAAYAVEGACAEWSALLLNTVKGAAESTAALGFGAFSVAIALGRLVGDNLRQKIGDFALLIAASTTAAIGMSVVLVSPWVILCLIGYALTGLGVAPIMPTVLSRAGSRLDITPKRATTVISTLGYSGLLVIPPSIGWLGQSFGLETAMLLPLGLTVLLMAGSFLFRYPSRV